MNSLIVAKDILREAKSMKFEMTQLRLMKLVYFVYGFYLGETGKDLFEDKETICAWKFGPVILNLRDVIKTFGNRSIDEGDIENEGDGTNNQDSTCSMDSELYQTIVKFVLRNFGDISISKLIDIVHKPSTPWYEIYHGNKFSDVIPHELSRRYFRRIIEKYE